MDDEQADHDGWVSQVFDVDPGNYSSAQSVAGPPDPGVCADPAAGQPSATSESAPAAAPETGQVGTEAGPPAPAGPPAADAAQAMQAPAPVAAQAALTPDDYYKQGRDAGHSGSLGACPAHADQAGEAAYEQGYTDGKQARTDEELAKQPQAMQPTPEQMVHKRKIAVVSDDGVGVTMKEFTGTDTQLDQIEEMAQRQVNQKEFENLTSLGETPAH